MRVRRKESRSFGASPVRHHLPDPPTGASAGPSPASRLSGSLGRSVFRTPIRNQDFAQTIGHSPSAVNPNPAASDPFYTGSPSATGAGRSQRLPVPPRTSSRRAPLPANFRDGPAAAPEVSPAA